MQLFSNLTSHAKKLSNQKLKIPKDLSYCCCFKLSSATRQIFEKIHSNMAETPKNVKKRCKVNKVAEKVHFLKF